MYNYTMKEFFIENCKPKTYLSSYILNKYPNLPKGSLFKAIRNKDIKVNEKRIKNDIFVNLNDKIQLYIADNILFNLPKKVSYIYEDDNIAVVFKPQGILSNNEERKISEPTLDDLVKRDSPNFIICHRLDRNTAGMVIFAKNNVAYNNILSAFKNSNITKDYLAYVAYFDFEKKEDTLNQSIFVDKKKGISKIYDNNHNLKLHTKDITTSYKVIYTNKKKDFAILKVSIHNGKTHQIRAVLSNLGHPIIGDSKYGKNEINKKFGKYKQLLFATSYTFNFEKDSNLSYLNDKNITLDESYYFNYIGDIYESTGKS